MKLTDSQEIATQMIIDNRYTIIDGDRQVGKSSLLLYIATRWLISNIEFPFNYMIIVSYNQIASDHLKTKFYNQFNNVEYSTVKFITIDELSNFDFNNNKLYGIFIDEASSFKRDDYNALMNDLAKQDNITKFVITGNIGDCKPGSFFSNILKTCSNSNIISEWVYPQFRHCKLYIDKTEEDKFTHNNPDFCSEEKQTWENNRIRFLTIGKNYIVKFRSNYTINDVKTDTDYNYIFGCLNGIYTKQKVNLNSPLIYSNDECDGFILLSNVLIAINDIETVIVDDQIYNFVKL